MNWIRADLFIENVIHFFYKINPIILNGEVYILKSGIVRGVETIVIRTLWIRAIFRFCVVDDPSFTFCPREIKRRKRLLRNFNPTLEVVVLKNSALVSSILQVNYILAITLYKILELSFLQIIMNLLHWWFDLENCFGK